MVAVAQLVERRSVAADVAGSNPFDQRLSYVETDKVDGLQPVYNLIVLTYGGRSVVVTRRSVAA
jgi:hypothetical protein